MNKGELVDPMLVEGSANRLDKRDSKVSKRESLGVVLSGKERSVRNKVV